MELVQSFLTANPQFRGPGYGGGTPAPWLNGQGEAAFYASYPSCRPSDAVLTMDRFVAANPSLVDTFSDGTRTLSQNGLMAFGQQYPEYAGDPALTTRLPVDAGILGGVLPDDQFALGLFGTVVTAAVSGYLGYRVGRSQSHRSQRAR